MQAVEILRIALAVILTGEQVFDVFSTSIVIGHGLGHEGNGVMAWLMGRLGHWWWAIKVPIVAGIWYDVLFHAPTVLLFRGVPLQISLIVPSLLALFYAWALVNNYRIAWGKT